MANKIATVRLSPGQVGYYDDLSRIHLTIGRPEGYVFAGMNCSQLRRSVKAGTITVVEGSLGENPQPYKLVKKNGKFVLSANKGNKAKTVVQTTPVKAEPKEEASKAEEPVVAEVKAEEKVEVAPIVEKPVAKETVKKAVEEKKEEKAPEVEEPVVTKKKTTKKSTKSKKAAD